MIYFGKREIEELYRRYPRLEAVGRHFAQLAYSCLQRKIDLLTERSPEERYEEFSTRWPELAQRVPQYHLAAYLNVQPESLSRIKRRLEARRAGG